MPAVVVLHALRPESQRSADLLIRTQECLGSETSLEMDRAGRIEIEFLGESHEGAMSRVKRALDEAGDDWSEYFEYESSG